MRPKQTSQSRSFTPASLIRGVSEDEVIAAFLKNDANDPAFRRHQDTIRKVLTNPDLENVGENNIRRALFFIRHRSLWSELPVGTDWYELEIDGADLEQIRVFPRAQWRKLAHGCFSIRQVVDNMRTRRHPVDAPFLDKISSLGDRFLKDDPGLGAVILIGLNNNEPLTILDGNHRVVAAMLSSPEGLKRVRFLCGLSPRMTECCWYTTNISTLFRYGTNLLSHSLRNPETDLARLLEQSG